jgi:hypothetical protein
VDKLSLAVISYGPQYPEWWAPFALMAGTLHRYDIQLNSVVHAGSMAADHNRNAVVDAFLESASDWLFWVDTDNVIPLGGIRRLLDVKNSLVTGLYFLKAPPYTPVAYKLQSDNRYSVIEGWTRGEIVPVDMAGMGACLVHRSVYEDIKKTHTVCMTWRGDTMVVPNSKIEGKLFDEPHSGQPTVKDGVMQFPMYEQKEWQHGRKFPFFMTNFGRTEDVVFWEMAKEAGHNGLCDTSVECPHVGQYEFTGETYRDHIRKEKVSVEGKIREYVIDREVYTP